MRAKLINLIKHKYINIFMLSILLASLVIPMLPQKNALANWGDANGYSFSMVFTANMSGVSSNLINSPTRIHLDTTNFDFSKVQPDLDDIRFLAMDDTTVLNTENASYDPIAQYADFWVSANWTALGDYSEYITMYYGKPTATSNWNGKTVWDNAGAVGVWHFDSTTNNGTGVGTTIFDSSSGGVNLLHSLEPAVTWSPDGRSFNGSGYIANNAAANYRIADDSGTILCYFKTTMTDSGEFFSSGDTATANYFLGTDIGTPGDATKAGMVRLGSNNNTTTTLIRGNGVYNDGNFHQVVFTGDNLIYTSYVDTNLQTQTVISGSNTGRWLNNVPNRDNLTWGASVRNTTQAYFIGTFKEGRIYNKVLSTSEIKASEMNLNNSFLYYGATKPVINTRLSINVRMDKDAVFTGNFSGNVSSKGNPVPINEWWKFGSTASLGMVTANISNNSTGLTTLSFTTSNLTPGGTLHVVFESSNLLGLSSGSDNSTPLTMPSVTTGTATNVGDIATLRSSISNMGVASSAFLYYQWNYLLGATHSTPEQTISATGSYSNTITYDPNKSIEYRSVIRVGSVYTYGSYVTLSAISGNNLFKTLIPIIVALVASVIFIGIGFTYGVTIQLIAVSGISIALIYYVVSALISLLF